jgi:hypothetical protein
VRRGGFRSDDRAAGRGPQGATVSFDTDTLVLLAQLGAAAALPAVRALHLPPAPAPGSNRGEFCAIELADGTLGLSYVLLGDTWAQLHAAQQSLANRCWRWPGAWPVPTHWPAPWAWPWSTR